MERRILLTLSCGSTVQRRFKTRAYRTIQGAPIFENNPGAAYSKLIQHLLDGLHYGFPELGSHNRFNLNLSFIVRAYLNIHIARFKCPGESMSYDLHILTLAI